MAGDTIVFENRRSFAFPDEIADKYIQAPENALRLIIFLLRHSSESFIKADISRVTGIPEGDLDGAFGYWVERGVLFRSAQGYTLSRPQIKPSDIHQYTAAEVANRMDTDGAIRFLYEKTENVIARPLSTTDAYTVLSLVDWIGLPPEVAAQLLQYCSDSGKKTMRLIEKTAVAWADAGINTFERAEEFIAAERAKAETVAKTSRILGISNRALGEEEKRVIIAWRSELDYGDDIIRAAYESMIKSLGAYKYQYLDKILRSWKAAGVKTPEDAAAQTLGAKKPVKTKKYDATKAPDAVKTVDASWEIMKKAVNESDE